MSHFSDFSASDSASVALLYLGTEVHVRKQCLHKFEMKKVRNRKTELNESIWRNLMNQLY
jgi:hypothetical protein